MKKRLALLIIGALTTLSAANPALAEKLKAATLGDYAPYSDAKLPDKGFSNDLLVEAMKRAGHEVEVTIMPWPRAVQGVQTGEYDILTTVWKNAERETTMVFSEPFVSNRIVFAKPADSPFEYKALGDLDGKTVGTVIGYAYGDDFMKAPSFKREETNSVVNNLRKVAGKRIDLTLEDELLMKYLINTQAADVKAQLAITSGALSDNPAYMAFSKKRGDAATLAADFNKGLAALKADGTYDKLLAKHGMK